MSIKILFLSDTHIGIDSPARPRINRRRRGDDFFENYLTALKPALEGRVDLVVHGGDLLYRSRVPAGMLSRAFAPLVEIAEKGIPVFVVPGNHERSKFNVSLFETHPNLHIFSQAETYNINIKDSEIALTGFPFYRGDIRTNFRSVLEQSGWRSHFADIRLLCMHHPVDGAVVGWQNYKFRLREDTIDIREIPNQFSAVLTGHIHKHQVLTTDLAGNEISTPIFYAGSIERTSSAERDEDKGYLILNAEKGEQNGSISSWHFNKLPARPMISCEIDVSQLDVSSMRQKYQNIIKNTDQNAVVQLKLSGTARRDLLPALRSSYVRSVFPPTMNVNLSYSSA